MKRYSLILLLTLKVTALNLDYLDPTKLQTKTLPSVQQETASEIISKYSSNVDVEVNPALFNDNKDVFTLRTSEGRLRIRASTGVAAVWGFNYYLKKYCKSQIAWQVKHVDIPDPLPEVNEVVVANDRFRYYQNVCTVSYSFVWWNEDQWMEHVKWMALNGINLVLAPVAQEAAWSRVYQQIGMTREEIDDHFTGPAFLSWLRMGNLRGWGGPLPDSWHDLQRSIQDSIIDYMFKLGMVPVFPAFSGHVPKAFARIYPQSIFYSVGNWNKFNSDYCCGLFLNPSDPLFVSIGQMFWKEITAGSTVSHIYTADPFNEVNIQPWSTALVQETSKAIFATISQVDQNAVWLVQNWMFVHDSLLWPKNRVKSFLTSVPNGRMVILDLQSEQWPQYDLYEMYFGQPFIWSMLHNFGGTLGMFGNMQTINKNVYDARSSLNSTMIGIGLTPEGINQNYVVYDLMLESAWRKNPVYDLEAWLDDYAERRYGCNSTGEAWKYLLKSVYSFNGLNKMRGKYVVTRRPSFKLSPWAWYKSRDLFSALRKFVFVPSDQCNSDGYYHDLVDVTRQALQYRAEQLYLALIVDRNSNTWTFNATINIFLDAMQDMKSILVTNSDFRITSWLNNARSVAKNDEQAFMYDLNARNQITLWGPNGEITDYACKQWAEMFHYYYIPRWSKFLSAALDAKIRREIFDEKSVQSIVRETVEKGFLTVPTDDLLKRSVDYLPKDDLRSLARTLFIKWNNMPSLEDLPNHIFYSDEKTMDDTVETDEPTVIIMNSTPPI